MWSGLSLGQVLIESFVATDDPDVREEYEAAEHRMNQCVQNWLKQEEP